VKARLDEHRRREQAAASTSALRCTDPVERERMLEELQPQDLRSCVQSANVDELVEIALSVKSDSLRERIFDASTPVVRRRYRAAREWQRNPVMLTRLRARAEHIPYHAIRLTDEQAAKLIAGGCAVGRETDDEPWQYRGIVFTSPGETFTLPTSRLSAIRTVDRDLDAAIAAGRVVAEELDERTSRAVHAEQLPREPQPLGGTFTRTPEPPTWRTSKYAALAAALHEAYTDESSAPLPQLPDDGNVTWVEG
jgi:hypothetical protein